MGKYALRTFREPRFIGNTAIARDHWSISFGEVPLDKHITAHFTVAVNKHPRTVITPVGGSQVQSMAYRYGPTGDVPSEKYGAVLLTPFDGLQSPRSFGMNPEQMDYDKGADKILRFIPICQQI